ncbi:hypothetical protein FACS189472_15350 [Alphaproteobacteria bacterium]|nr:hypothetical protein FACS189472_15350 [Alphaproteobacteria bacterium]
MSLPSLNLSFEKHTATSQASSNTNDNSAKNSVVLNFINPLNGGERVEPRPVTPCSPKPIVLSPKSIRRDFTEEIPEVYQSPVFEDVEKEFKDQLLSFTTELLLSDFDVLKNITERGSKILLHKSQLKKLIAILYLYKEDRVKWNELVTIDTEKISHDNCFCKSCVNPFYEKIKHILVSNTVYFMATPYAVNMTSTFQISLEFCLTETFNSK